MMGYLNNAEATAEVIDKDGWFHSGDIAEIRNDRVYITGRIKDIIVLSNGEKVPPSDMEIAIARDPIFEQVLVLGEGKPFLSALIVLEKEQYATFAKTNGFPETICDACKSPEVVEALLSKVKQQLHAFPGYAVVRQITIMSEPWTIENEMATPTLKLKRKVIIDHCQQDIDNMYSGH
jgi:long-chain acyl-CoA synthetase